MRSILRSSILAGIALWLLSPALSLADRPNIVLILADDMGWSDPGCYGSEIPTPALVTLARQGMLA
ncbi:MAG: sulfatase-like hydrolase/transferase, partial [Akkermansia muciniphila]